MPFIKSIVLLSVLCSFLYANDSMTFNLVWLPSISLDEIDNVDFSKLMKHKYLIEVTDDRDVKEEIGRNVENKDKGIIKKVFTKSNVSEFVKKNTINCFKKYGLDLTSNDTSKITIRLQIIEYYVLEESIYKGILKTKVVLLDKNSNEILKTLTIGESRPWGKSFSKENYLNTLSNCIIDNVKSILKNKEISNAISGVD